MVLLIVWFLLSSFLKVFLSFVNDLSKYLMLCLDGGRGIIMPLIFPLFMISVHEAIVAKYLLLPL